MHQVLLSPTHHVLRVCTIATFLVAGFAFSISATTPEDEAPLLARQTALDHVQEERATLGLSTADLAEVTVTNQYVSRHTGTSHLYLQQRANGIPVYNGLISVAVTSSGHVAHVGNRFVANLGQSILPGDRVMDAAEAVEYAAEALGLEKPTGLRIVSTQEGAERRTELSSGGISQSNIPARLVYQRLSSGGLRLAWDLTIEVFDADHWWGVRIDADSGQLLDTNDLVAQEQYLTYGIPVESPNHTTPVPPADARAIEVDPFAAGSGSPLGWHDTNNVAGPEFTITRGNNVHAYADRNGNNAPDVGADAEPDGGGALNFTGALVPIDLSVAPNNYVPAAIANLFYWNNIIHDVLYEYGFDEVSGNFQVNNYGNGGAGGDDVQAEAQDGGGNCNANFGTPADGGRPRMQMFTCTNTTPTRDGDFDHGVVTHEYGHGVSNRLTGGPAAAGCLSNTEQMGEGWSDYLGLMLTMEAGDVGTDSRGTGTYLFGQPADGPGIRPSPYSIDVGVNSFTYGGINGVSVPHGVGFVWATMLWDMTWALIDENGLNPDIYGDWTTGGNNLALQLVMDGMKLQSCNPGFVDGRDGILTADDILTGDGSTGSGVNQCTIWKAFADRGLGVSADQGSSQSVSDGTEAFDVPDYCSTIGAVNDSVNICVGDMAIFRIGVGDSFSPPVDLSTSGEPAGTTTSFSDDPVVGPLPATSDLTVSNTAGAAPGTYMITITGDDTGGFTNTSAKAIFDTTVELNVFAGVPGSAPTLMSPADSMTDEIVQPTFEWAAVADTLSYTLEVDDDPAFGSIDYTVSGLIGTTHSVGVELSYDTTYYWRVRADNTCGGSANPTAFSFTTAIFPGDCAQGIAQNFHFEDDLEIVGGWSSSGTGDTWALSGARVISGASAFFATDPETLSDQRLVSPSITLPGGVSDLTLQFQNYQAFETPNGDGRCWDAGVLEISTDNGVSWAQVPAGAMLSDPYDNIIWNDTAGNNPITNDYGATTAWCNELQPYLRSVVDLSAYSGTVRFAWRLGSDGAAGNEGWYIDDVSVRSCPSVGIFSDDFEDGTFDAWSNTVP
jgi:extracellular elastinolytic metalloproteinase